MDDRVIGHYRVLEKIGEGAMGEVFRARDERLGRDVALKLIKPHLTGDPDHRRRFELEARAAASLNHPNIVTIYDVGSHDGRPYIVSELLQGKTLRKRLAEGALPVRLAIDYSAQTVQGLIAAHDRRITHRDLKPENLFLTTDGVVKILDFGVAKLQPESGVPVEELPTETRMGGIVGTVPYMSPEQLRDKKKVDRRSDIFSVGTILYEMLAGHRAFKGETEVDTITAVLKEDPPEIDLERAGIPVSLRQIVDHCLEKEPENRFQSARDLAFALGTLSDASGGRPKRLSARRWQVQIILKILPWAVAGVLLVATLFLLASRVPSPTYQRLTFDKGTVYAARFAPDYRSVVYGAAWNGGPLQIFSTGGDSLSTQSPNFMDANVLAISKTGELALLLNGDHRAHLEIENGMLAVAPLAGGSFKPILEDIRWADWGTNDDLAVVVHRAEGRDQIEYPIGHVLYQSSGWISHIRLSPQADKVAFINHPEPWDDRGTVCLVDLAGQFKTLSQEYGSADGLAWSSDGKEVWFTAVENGYARRLLAVSTTGTGVARTVLSVPEGMTLQDIAPDGRVLVSVNSERLSMATSAQKGKASDLSSHDWDVAKDISRDGQSVLFEDASEAAPPNHSVEIRRIDGTLPVYLGEGSAGGLSPDGKWAISIIPGSPGRVMLLPTSGPSKPLAIPVTGLERIDNGNSHFVADGTKITINGNEPRHGVRCYIVNRDGGKPTPITPEGITGGLVSPDGQSIVADDGPVSAVYPIAGGPPRPIPGLEPGFVPIQWSENNSAIYGYHPGQIPTKVYKVNLVTGEKSVIQDLQPEASAGVVYIAPVVVSHDGSRFAYSYYQVVSVLYIISGLH
ncbi:MAG: protein kinase [Candidatus Sulfotelmatobacter sp.]